MITPITVMQGRLVGMSTLGGGSIAWSAKKHTVSLSTTEAEYIALTEGAKGTCMAPNGTPGTRVRSKPAHFHSM